MPINSAPENLPDLLGVARGDKPADLLLRNARIVNVFSGQIEECDIAILRDRIAGVGAGYQAHQTVDLQRAFVAPGLIDAHVHIESSLCIPPQFARAVVPRGITTVVADPHEIANVAGVDGVRFMADCSRSLPLRVVLMGSSCVPATSMATSGAELSADDLARLRADGTVYGLSEVMNFPGVIAGDGQILAKLRAFADRPKDGHAPAVCGKRLNAYVASGIGSEHEAVTVEEAREKLSRGMYIFIREATNALVGERFTEAPLQRPDERVAHRVVVVLLDAVAEVARAQVLEDRQQRRRIRQAAHGAADHRHQHAALLLHVALEQAPQRWIHFEQPPVEHVCGGRGDRQHVHEAFLHQLDLAGGHGISLLLGLHCSP
jgi:adenine deaminase